MCVTLAVCRRGCVIPSAAGSMLCRVSKGCVHQPRHEVLDLTHLPAVLFVARSTEAAPPLQHQQHHPSSISMHASSTTLVTRVLTHAVAEQLPAQACAHCVVLRLNFFPGWKPLLKCLVTAVPAACTRHIRCHVVMADATKWRHSCCMHC